MMVLQIALDLRVAFHERRGIPRYVQNFAKTILGMEINGFDIFFLIPTHHKKEAEEILSLRENSNIVFLEEKTIWHWEQFLLPKWCKEEKIELLHMFTNRGPVFNRGVADVHVVHDTIAIHEGIKEKGLFKGISGILYNFFTIKLSAKTSSHLITVSNFSKETILKELRVPPSKVSVVYNGVDPMFFNPPELEIEKLNLPKKSFLFHLGSYEPRKNTLRVLQAYSGLKEETRRDFPLVIAGLSQKAKEKFCPIIQELGIEKDVVVLPFISDEDLAGLYHNCLAFVWPSCWEGFGLPVLEAMAAGAPVLTSNATSLPEISGGCALLVDPFKVGEIKEGIIRLISDYTLREKMREKGKAWAQQFTWENTVKKTIEIWKEVLGS
ncbi:MAG: glycosyltransferase family 4 protein [Caldiserica bacterium]|jgi:glycosyltransferase involved in cell wall biosynthesis|nr:glycosyltransferase family 4 protein [Caldisericota bacterium]MDH7562177.1 glycosyltransferase family 1 protein [Caldisericota bacterium]